MNDINPIPIKELITKKNPIDNVIYSNHYVIPDYQRGYRWDEINVTTLLNDIHDFKISNTDLRESYCLQPIVVNKIRTEQKNIYWEVIDGQQRLITLYLIINFITRTIPDEICYTISFDKRDKSNVFLKKLIIEENEDHSNPDFHYMSMAYRVIKDWFKQKRDEDRSYLIGFYQTLFDRVKVLFYEVDCQTIEEKQVIFERLNIGKIPLSDAELIKALILSKIKGDLTDRELNLRQAEISNEWQRIETELRKPEKWLFLNIRKEYSSHIELLFDLIANQKEKTNYSTYLYFERQIKDSIVNIDDSNLKLKLEAEKAEELWNNVKQLFAIINSWFCQNSPDKRPTLYHYVGYLLSTGQKKIEELIAMSKSDKDIFMSSLKEAINESLKGVSLSELSYGVNDNAIHRVLLLFNVLTCEKIARGNNNRFPFDRYVEIDKMKAKGGWSLEHIHAQNSQEPIKSKKAIRTWIDDTLSSLRNITHVNKKSDKIHRTVELCEYISILTEMRNALINDGIIDIDKFNTIKDNIIAIFDSQSVHDISNLALLSKDDNSRLNNAIFPVKRDYIISLEKEGQFIPPCTRNVFLKFYSESNSQPYYWSSEDKRQYFAMIKDTINEIAEEGNIL